MTAILTSVDDTSLWFFQIKILSNFPFDTIVPDNVLCITWMLLSLSRLVFFLFNKNRVYIVKFSMWTQKKWILLLLNGVLYKCQLLLIVFFFSLSVWYHIFYSLSVWLFSYISFWKGILKFLIVFVYLPISPFSSEFLLHLFSSFVLRCLNS